MISFASWFSDNCHLKWFTHTILDAFLVNENKTIDFPRQSQNKYFNFERASSEKDVLMSSIYKWWYLDVMD